MKYGGLFLLVFLCNFFVGLVFAQDQPIRYDFSGESLQANGLTILGAGFVFNSRVNISFGDVPTDNAFSGATDGKGAIIQAEPGEGIMIFFPFVTTDRTAQIRCSVRTKIFQHHPYIWLPWIRERIH